MKETVKLLRVCDRKVIDSDLLDLSPKHLADFDTFWKARLQPSDAEDLYSELEMVDFGNDADKQNLKYFELSSDKALAIPGSRC